MKKVAVVLALFILFSTIINLFLKAKIDLLETEIKEQDEAIAEMKNYEMELRRSVEEILKKRGEDGMQDQMLLNGKPRCTLIQSFDGGAIIIGPRNSVKIKLKNLHDVEKTVDKLGWVISIIHPSLKKDKEA